MKKLFKSIIFMMLCVNALSHASLKLEESYVVVDPAKKLLKKFTKHDFVIDHVTKNGYELYGPKGTYDYLIKVGAIFYYESLIRNTGLLQEYPTPEQIVQKLKNLNTAYPALTQLISIGKSIKGRELLIMKISNNASVDQIKPEVKYISSMHGDEITGRELMISLIEDLLSNYGKDQKITKLIDNTEIYIMPSFNPDGSAMMQRYNANGTDINRNFPDFSTNDNQNTPNGRAVETQAMMRFQASRKFALSANFHGGAEVVNYPWDTIAEPFPMDALIRDISLEYASSVPYMKSSSEFPNGITNGYAWYEVNGGMQDWSYNWHNDMQVTIELSGTKWPSYSTIPGYYQSNRTSLIRYLETVHQGAGFYFSDNVKTPKTGTVHIYNTSTGHDLGSYAFSDSEFYKVLAPGNYRFEIQSKDGANINVNANVEANKVYENGNYIKL